VAGGRTGRVFLRNFDEGVVTTLGGELVLIELDGEQVQDYAVRINGVQGPEAWGGMVPVIFQNPEDVYQDGVMPHIAVSRTAITPAMNRWNPMGRAYMVPAGDGETHRGSDGQQYPKRVEIATYPYPYDISYDLHLRGRRRSEADLMLLHVGRYFFPYGQVFLKDSEGDERGYYAFQESIDNLDEVAAIADRTLGHTLSLRVEAELDFNDPWIAPTTPNLGVRVLSKSGSVGQR